MNKQMRFAAALPLIGLNAAWVIYMFAAWADHREIMQSLTLDWAVLEVKASTFLYLGAIAVFAVVASIAHRVADQQMSESPNPGTHAVFRFASLAVIIGLVAGAIFAVATFLNSFQTYSRPFVTVGGRLVGVYLPIVLATALVVFVLLRVTVFRKSADSDKDASGKMSAQQRAMVLGYSLPIVATAIAIILGLAFWDIQGQSLDNWVWVVILAIVASGLVFGTRFAVAARAGKPIEVKPRMTGAAAIGALNLNYVLSVVFGAIVTLMAFVIGSSSFSMIDYRGMDTSWFFKQLLPAYVMLVLVTLAVYATLITRHKNENPKAE